MGDISKLNVGGTLYDIKDAKARTDVSDLKEDKAYKGTVGFNVWNEEWEVVNGHIENKSPIPCTPNTEYYIKSPSLMSNGFRFYNANMTQTGVTIWGRNVVVKSPGDACYMGFGLTSDYGTTYNHDICINISQPNADVSPHNGDYVSSDYLKNYSDVIKNKIDIYNLSNKVDREINEISELIFDSTEQEAVDSAVGWRLNENDGFCSSNENYKMLKFSIDGGGFYKIFSDDRFQFQDNISVPSSGTSHRIGDTYKSGTFLVQAPTNATYIIISTPVQNSEAHCYSAIAKGSESAEITKAINNAQHIPAWSGVGDALTILHFSDLHADVGAMKRIVSKSADYAELIDDMICTGDIVANTAEQITSWWDEKIMTCIGNHDSASYSQSTGYNWTALSMAERDVYYIAPFEDNWSITHESGKSYYYKDYTNEKVRLIVMDVMLYNDNGAEATAQTAWLSNLLSSAITDNLHVLIAIHTVHGGATAKECSFSRYGQGTMPTYPDCNTPQVVIDTVSSAISNGLHFIGYIVGHTHQDNICDAENDGKQLMYCITCANVNYIGQWENSDQYRSEKEDAFNLITIDTNRTLVKIIRGGGADIDDHMRTRKAICFNYSTGEKVGEIL